MTFIAGERIPPSYRARVEDTYRYHHQSFSRDVALGQPALSTNIATDSRWTALRDDALAVGWRAAYLHPVQSPDGPVTAAIACYFVQPYVPTSDERVLIAHCAVLVALAVVVDEVRSHTRLWLSGLAHELRNQLGVMALVADGLETTLTPLAPYVPSAAAATVAGRLGTLRNHIAVQGRLIDGILHLAQVPAGPLSLHREAVRLNTLVGAVGEAFYDQARMLGIELAWKTPVVWIMGDPDRVRQILVNLVQNSLKYTPRGGHIVIRLAVAGSQVTLEVQDSGVGFPPEDANRMFSWFGRGSQRPVQDVRAVNAGLGLALVHEFVRQQGGDIVAQSPGIGRGCCVTVTLPALRPDAIPSTNGPNGVPHADPGRQILLVDDNASFREVMTALLENAGLHVEAVGSGQEALSRSTALPPPWGVLCDVTLPDGPGWWVARRLRELPGWDGVPIVALTGQTERTAAELRTLGYTNALFKPVPLKKILDEFARYHSPEETPVPPFQAPRRDNEHS